MLLDTSGTSHGTAVTALGAGGQEQEELGERQAKPPPGLALQGGDTGHQQVTVLGTELGPAV